MTHQYVKAYGKDKHQLLKECEYIEGDWGLGRTLFTPAKHKWVVIHVCDPKLKQSEDLTARNVAMVECWYYWRHFNLPCTHCGELIPESLQTLFVLATGDMDEMKYVQGWK